MENAYTTKIKLKNPVNLLIVTDQVQILTSIATSDILIFKMTFQQDIKLSRSYDAKTEHVAKTMTILFSVINFLSSFFVPLCNLKASGLQFNIIQYIKNKQN